MVDLASLPTLLDGYNQRIQRDQTAEQAKIAQATSLAGLMQRLEEQGRQRRVREVVMQSGGNLGAAARKLMSIGDINGARLVMQMAGEQQKIDQTQRAADFHSPENLARFIQPGRAAIPDFTSDDAGLEPSAAQGTPAVAPSMNLQGLLQAGVAQGQIPINAATLGVLQPKPAFHSFGGGGYVEDPAAPNGLRQVVPPRETSPTAAPSEVRLWEAYNALPDGHPKKAYLKKILDNKAVSPDERRQIIVQNPMPSAPAQPHAVIGVDDNGKQVVNWVTPPKPGEAVTQTPLGTNPVGIAGIDLRDRQANIRQMQSLYTKETKGERDILGQFNTYEAVRNSGNNAQATLIAADILRRATRSGNQRFKGEVEAILGGGYRGGSGWERFVSNVSQLATGTPPKEIMNNLDKLMVAAENAALETISNRNAYYAGQAQPRQISPQSVVGNPLIRGSRVVMPNGDRVTYESPEAARRFVSNWIKENPIGRADIAR